MGKQVKRQDFGKKDKVRDIISYMPNVIYAHAKNTTEILEYMFPYKSTLSTCTIRLYGPPANLIITIDKGSKGVLTYEKNILPGLGTIVMDEEVAMGDIIRVTSKEPVEDLFISGLYYLDKSLVKTSEA